MSRIIWREMIYRCDGPNCHYGADCDMDEVFIQENSRKADKIIKAAGWVIKKNGRCYCPECAKKGVE